MVNKEVLLKNLLILKTGMPKKPKAYTPDYPLSLEEALTKYSNIRSVSGLEKNTSQLMKFNWPLPLWVDPSNVKLGEVPDYIHLLYRRSWKVGNNPKNFNLFNWLNVPVMANSHKDMPIDEVMPGIFDENLNYYEQKVTTNNLLSPKASIFREAINLYKLKLYAGSIALVFPVIDFTVRKLLKTNKLTISVNRVCKIFQECGFTNENIEHLMPGVAIETFIKADSYQGLIAKLSGPGFQELIEKLKPNSFGIIGPALSSFLYFSNHYYGYYKEDVPESTFINRHSILHGSSNDYNTRSNNVKLFTYLFLMIELEPIFNILFKED